MVGGEGLVEVPYMEEQTGSPAAANFSFNPSNGLHKWVILISEWDLLQKSIMVDHWNVQRTPTHSWLKWLSWSGVSTG